ncbi:hypothetical protein GCM10020331_098310 [Ectobacillus funiculus]
MDLMLRPLNYLLTVKKSGSGVSGIRNSKVELQSDTLSLHLYLDRSSVEVFANEGFNVMTSRIYPQTSSLDFQLYAKKMERFVSKI